MSDHFSERANVVVHLATQEAIRLGKDFVSPEHIFLGLAGEGTGMVVSLLKRKGICLKSARRAVEYISGKYDKRESHKAQIEFDESAKAAFRYASEITGSKDIDAEHLLVGILHCPDPTITDSLRQLSTSTTELEKALANMHWRNRSPL
jgi:ATP-dependent Clp protease ATP-binding subunit ClpA